VLQMSSAVPVNKLKDDEKIKLIKIVMAVCGVIFLLSAFYLFSNKDDIGARYRTRDLLSEISRASGSLQLISANIDDKAKTFECTFIGGNSHTADTCNAAREAVNQYLNENKDFFLNNGYLIQITIRGNRNGPTYMIISNRNYYNNSKSLYDTLSSLEIIGWIDNISSYKNWTDIQTLLISDINIDDISVLSQFTQLEYISKAAGFTAQDTQAIKQMLPHCKIVSFPAILLK